MQTLTYSAAAVGGAALAVVLFVVVSMLNDTRRAAEALPIASPAMNSDPTVAVQQTIRTPTDSQPLTARPATEADIVRGFGGEGPIAVLRNAKQVSVVSIWSDDPQHSRPHEYKLVGDWEPVPPKVASAIVALVLDPKSYQIFDQKQRVARGCFPVYFARMEFQAGEERVDLYFCLGCAALAVYSQGEHAGGMDIAGITTELAKEFVQLFPDDDSLQGLAGLLPPRPLGELPRPPVEVKTGRRQGSPRNTE
jgi:hypothetical protein